LDGAVVTTLLALSPDAVLMRRWRTYQRAYNDWRALSPWVRELRFPDAAQRADHYDALADTACMAMRLLEDRGFTPCSTCVIVEPEEHWAPHCPTVLGRHV
jgi:hypothetical protein